MLGVVLLLGCIYSAPNLFQPDPALQRQRGLGGSEQSEMIDEGSGDELA